MCNDKLSVIVFQHFVLCPSGFSTALLSELSTCLQYTYDIVFICLCVFNVHRLAGSEVCSRIRAGEMVPGNLWKVRLVGGWGGLSLSGLLPSQALCGFCFFVFFFPDRKTGTCH